MNIYRNGVYFAVPHKHGHDLTLFVNCKKIENHYKAKKRNLYMRVSDTAVQPLFGFPKITSIISDTVEQIWRSSRVWRSFRDLYIMKNKHRLVFGKEGR